ncbi:MAG: type II and III secretion system protein [bacterium]|nr:MAG: type II and III secretion system protein [bacterium]
MNLSNKKLIFIFTNACYFIIIALVINQNLLYAQQTIPREYKPEEFISLSRELPMNAALEIINQLTMKYENKMLIDPKEHKNKIGVDVDNMHWKRALEYILRSNLLKYVVHPRHYEITELGNQKGTSVVEEKVTFTTREIEIKAIFFEADQQALSEVGVDWSTLNNGKVQLQVISKSASTVSDESYSMAAGYSTKTWDVLALIRAFQSSNKGQVIATPQIRIMEGEEGKIKVGKNFFLTTRDFAGNTLYREYESGTILSVIPQIITQGKLSFIHLEINAEKSDVLPTGSTVIKKITEGKTQVILLNGEETAIAGLFSNELASARKGIPFLKDLPWWFFGLRYIFGYNYKQMVKKELIILIKAEIVPNLLSRLKSKVVEKNILKERKKEFEQRVREFKKNR